MRTNSRNWSSPTSWEIVCKRAAGRRRYNSARQSRALDRRYELLTFLVESDIGVFTWGIRAVLADKFGVHPATISRDIKALLKRDADYEVKICEKCGQVERDWLDDYQLELLYPELTQS